MDRAIEAILSSGSSLFGLAVLSGKVEAVLWVYQFLAQRCPQQVLMRVLFRPTGRRKQSMFSAFLLPVLLSPSLHIMVLPIQHQCYVFRLIQRVSQAYGNTLNASLVSLLYFFGGVGGHAEGHPTVGVALTCLLERVECSRRLRSAPAWGNNVYLHGCTAVFFVYPYTANKQVLEKQGYFSLDRGLQLWENTRGAQGKISPLTCASSSSMKSERHGVEILVAVYNCLQEVSSGNCCLVP